MARGLLAGFSVERLLRFLLALQHDVEITIKQNAGGRSEGRLTIVNLV